MDGEWEIFGLGTLGTKGLKHLTCGNYYVYIWKSRVRKEKEGYFICDWCEKRIPDTIIFQLKLLGVDI